jgi:hypothetical protein
MPGNLGASPDAEDRAHRWHMCDSICLFVVFFIAAAASFNGFYTKWSSIILPGVYQHSTARIDYTLDGALPRPYAYRRLLPDIANFADRVAPDALKNWLAAPRPSAPSRIAWFLAAPSTITPYAFRFLLIYLEAMLFAILSLYAMYWVCGELAFPPLASIFAPVLLILFVPYTMNMGGYFYDYSELAFFALAAWVALRFNGWGLIPIAAIATWNKESFLLFIPTLYPMLRRGSSSSRRFLTIGLSEIAGSIVYLIIRARFAHNAGSALQIHWRDQIHYFLDPHKFLFALDNTYGAVTPSVATLLPLALLAWVVYRHWPQLPVAIRQHARIAAAINFPLFFLFCAPGELRNLSLLYLAFLVTLATMLSSWTGHREATP